MALRGDVQINIKCTANTAQSQAPRASLLHDHHPPPTFRLGLGPAPRARTTARRSDADVESGCEVRHLIATRLRDLTPLLGNLMTGSGDFR